MKHRTKLLGNPVILTSELIVIASVILTSKIIVISHRNYGHFDLKNNRNSDGHFDLRGGRGHEAQPAKKSNPEGPVGTCPNSPKGRGGGGRAGAGQRGRGSPLAGTCVRAQTATAKARFRR